MQISSFLDSTRAIPSLFVGTSLVARMKHRLRPSACLISAKPQPRKLEAWRKSGSAQGLQPIIA